MKEKLQTILDCIQQAKNHLEILDESKDNNSTFIKTGTLDLLKYAIKETETAIKEDEEEPTERFEVRKKLVQILGLPSTKDECHRFEEAFDWVMNGKKVDRGGKLFCLEYARKHERRDYASALSMAKCIFDVLL